MRSSSALRSMPAVRRMTLMPFGDFDFELSALRASVPVLSGDASAGDATRAGLVGFQDDESTLRG